MNISTIVGDKKFNNILRLDFQMDFRQSSLHGQIAPVADIMIEVERTKKNDEIKKLVYQNLEQDGDGKGFDVTAIEGGVKLHIQKPTAASKKTGVIVAETAVAEVFPRSYDANGKTVRVFSFRADEIQYFDEENNDHPAAPMKNSKHAIYRGGK